MIRLPSPRAMENPYWNESQDVSSSTVCLDPSMVSSYPQCTDQLQLLLMASHSGKDSFLNTDDARVLDNEHSFAKLVVAF